MGNRTYNLKQSLEREVKELYYKGTLTYVAATAVADLTNDITYTSVAAGPARNTNTITIEVEAAASNAGDAILATFTGTSAAVVCNITPHLGDVATATLNLTDDVVITTEAVGATRNTNTITLQVLAAAANPTDTVLIAVSGTSAATVITVTPNDGTNNSATPVNLTSAQLAAYIAADGVSGTYGGVVVTASGTPSLLTGLAATGGGATALADAGEGDGVVATFSGGSDALSCTTANLVELFNDGVITGKTVTLTDASSLRELQTASGGGAQALTAGGEGDDVVATFSAGSISVSKDSGYGFASVTWSATGTFDVILEDVYYSLKSAKAIYLSATAADIRYNLKSQSITSKLMSLLSLTGATATNPPDGSSFLLKVDVKNSTGLY